MAKSHASIADAEVVASSEEGCPEVLVELVAVGSRVLLVGRRQQ